MVGLDFRIKGGADDRDVWVAVEEFKRRLRLNPARKASNLLSTRLQ